MKGVNLYRISVTTLTCMLYFLIGLFGFCDAGPPPTFLKRVNRDWQEGSGRGVADLVYYSVLHMNFKGLFAYF